MQPGGDFHPEWGYVAPTSRFLRTLRMVFVTAVVSAVAGATVVYSLVQRSEADPGIRRTLTRATVDRPYESEAAQSAQRESAAARDEPELWHRTSKQASRFRPRHRGAPAQQPARQEASMPIEMLPATQDPAAVTAEASAEPQAKPKSDDAPAAVEPTRRATHTKHAAAGSSRRKVQQTPAFVLSPFRSFLPQ